MRKHFRTFSLNQAKDGAKFGSLCRSKQDDTVPAISHFGLEVLILENGPTPHFAACLAICMSLWLVTSAG